MKNIVDIYLVIQYEAFLRYKGAPYFKESLKSLQYKPFFDITIFHKFRPTDFTPVPKIDVVFAHFMPKTKPDISEENKKIYLDFLAYVFTANGATLKQKLSKIFSYEQIKRSMKIVGYTNESSVSKLSYEQWIKLFNIYLSFVTNDKKSIVKGSYEKLLKHQKRLFKVHRNRNQK